TAELDPVVLDVLDRVAARGTEVALRRSDVVRFELLVRVEEARRPAERVAAALGDEVDLHAGALLGRVAAARRDLDFVERVEVIVGRRGIARRDVADDRAVEVPLLVRAAAEGAE